MMSMGYRIRWYPEGSVHRVRQEDLWHNEVQGMGASKRGDQRGGATEFDPAQGGNTLMKKQGCTITGIGITMLTAQVP